MVALYKICLLCLMCLVMIWYPGSKGLFQIQMPSYLYLNSGYTDETVEPSYLYDKNSCMIRIPVYSCMVHISGLSQDCNKSNWSYCSLALSHTILKCAAGLYPRPGLVTLGNANRWLAASYIICELCGVYFDPQSHSNQRCNLQTTQKYPLVMQQVHSLPFLFNLIWMPILLMRWCEDLLILIIRIPIPKKMVCILKYDSGFYPRTRFGYIGWCWQVIGSILHHKSSVWGILWSSEPQ